MTLHIAFGINGVGKDRVLREVQRELPDLTVTSETKLLMHGLGIIDGYGQNIVPGREHYSALEQTSQPEIQQVEDNFGQWLEDDATHPMPVVMTSHLIPAQLLLGKVNYLIKPKPACHYRLAQTLMHFTVSPEIVLQRRQVDSRDRGAMSIEEIAMHQELYDTEWARLKQAAEQERTPAKFVDIVNYDLVTAVDRTITALMERI